MKKLFLIVLLGFAGQAWGMNREYDVHEAWTWHAQFGDQKNFNALVGIFEQQKKREKKARVMAKIRQHFPEYPVDLSDKENINQQNK
jgi:hypothetical protein